MLLILWGQHLHGTTNPLRHRFVLTELHKCWAASCHEKTQTPHLVQRIRQHTPFQTVTIVIASSHQKSSKRYWNKTACTHPEKPIILCVLITMAIQKTDDNVWCKSKKHQYQGCCVLSAAWTRLMTSSPMLTTSHYYLWSLIFPHFVTSLV